MAIEQWLVTGPKTIDIQTVRSVRANLLRGDISFIADDGTSARVEIARVDGRELKVAIDGDTLTIDHPQLSTRDLELSAKTLWEGPSASVCVRVPRSAPIKVRTSGAEVLVSGTEAPVSIATVTGDQFVDGVTGPARLSSSGGELSVRGHRGSIVARTVSGDLVLAGAIDNAELATVTGAAVVDITGTLPDNVSFQSVSGGLTLRLPKDATPSFAVTGVTTSPDLDGQRIPTLAGRTWRSAKREYAAELTEVRIATISGRISVVRGADTRAERHLGILGRSPVGERDAHLDESIDERLRAAGERLDEPVGDAAAPTGSALGDLEHGAADEHGGPGRRDAQHGDPEHGDLEHRAAREVPDAAAAEPDAGVAADAPSASEPGPFQDQGTGFPDQLDRTDEGATR